MSEDYVKFLDKHGFTDEWVISLMNTLTHPVANIIVDGSFSKMESNVHGVGMFATVDVSKDDTFPVHIGGQRTNLARYVNHSYSPNVRMVFNAGEIWMEMLNDVSSGEEITVDYEENMMQNGSPAMFREMCDEFMKRKRARECDAF